MQDEINPASIVREFLSECGMNVSAVRSNRDAKPYCTLWDGPSFFVTLPSNDLATVKTHWYEPRIRVESACANKIPVRHFKNGGIYWLEQGEWWEFDLHDPDSLQRIYDFLNPEQR